MQCFPTEPEGLIFYPAMLQELAVQRVPSVARRAQRS